MSRSNATVTVIIPTFNRAAFLAASLESVLTQSHAPAQVIVVNDGSTDETEAVLEPFRSRITYLAKDNGGKPSAINAALPLVEGDYLWVFDDDDIALPDALERSIRTLERHPEAGFTFGTSYHCTSHPGTGYLCVEGERRIIPFPEEDYFFELLMSSYVGSPAVVVRSSIQAQAGPYREDLYRSQDWEIGLRWGLIAPACRTEGDGPIFFRRFHQGLRGHRGQRFDYGENTPRARAAERHILRTLGYEIPLDRYLPHHFWGSPLDRANHRLALIRRISVQLRKGMWEEATQGLDHLAEGARAPLWLSEAEENALVRALTDYAIDEELPVDPDVDALRAVLRHPRLESIHRVLGPVLYWKWRGRMAQGQPRQAFRAWVAHKRLLGLSATGKGLFSAFRKRLAPGARDGD